MVIFFTHNILYELVVFVISLMIAKTFGVGVFFVRSPDSTVAPYGHEVVFECEVNLDPDRLEWLFWKPSHDKLLSESRLKYLREGGGYNYSISNNKLVSKLQVLATQDTIGEYRCVGWFGPVSVTSIAAKLALPSIKMEIDDSSSFTTILKKWVVPPMNSVIMRCGNVRSNPPAVWSFYHNGIKLQQNTELAMNGVLLLENITSNNSGNYTCLATNILAAESLWMPHQIELQVKPHITTRQAPYFLDYSLLATVVKTRVGDTIILECPGLGIPKPKVNWSNSELNILNNNRTHLLQYGLKISKLRANDSGKYICRLDNGVGKPLEHIISLVVHVPPYIEEGPNAALTNEGESVKLRCNGTGNPTPKLLWLINGETVVRDNDVNFAKNLLIIRRVQKRHAGIIQCFASNELGEVSANTLLQVNPNQIQSDVGLRSTALQSGKQRKQHRLQNGKHPHMVPPTAPNVTRLSDESVMLRWQVPNNNGLPVQFFKVQYRMIGDKTGNITRENWHTTNEDIPFGKRTRNSNFSKSFTTSVASLKPERFYRFRIIAVYSNDDNKESGTSVKFYLQLGVSLGITNYVLPVPKLLDIESNSDATVILHWSLSEDNENAIDGYYAYYRPAASAGEYCKTTIETASIRKFTIGALEPGTIYEFKLQSFNSLSASEFSLLKQGRTQKIKTVLTPITSANNTIDEVINRTYSSYLFLVGIISGSCLLLSTVIISICIRKRKNVQPKDKNKHQLKPLQHDNLEISGYSPAKMSSQRQQYAITLNPMSQHEDMNTSPNHLTGTMLQNVTSQPLFQGYPYSHQVHDSEEPITFNGVCISSSSSQHTVEHC